MWVPHNFTNSRTLLQNLFNVPIGSFYDAVGINCKKLSGVAVESVGVAVGCYENDKKNDTKSDAFLIFGLTTIIFLLAVIFFWGC